MRWRSRSARLTARLEAECGEAGRELARAKGEEVPYDLYEIARTVNEDVAARRAELARKRRATTVSLVVSSGVIVLLILLLIGMVLSL